MNCHASPLHQNVIGEKYPGHVLILGETGAGKSMLNAVITAYYSRFDPLFFGIDFNRSMELSVRAFGGHYFAIREGVPTGIQPFQLGEADDPDLMSFLYRVVGRCAAGQEASIAPEDEMQIKQAVDAVMALSNPADRRFSTLMQYLPKGTSLRLRLMKWCERATELSAPGELAWALDSATNRFNPAELERIAFDTTSLLDKKMGYNPATEPVLATLLFIKDRMQRSGRIMQTVIEEFWMPASHPMTQDQIKAALKAGRLKGEFVVLLSQSPEDAINCPIFAAIGQQTPTKALLPNRDAKWEGYQDIGLTEKEFAELKKLDKDSRTFLVRQSSASTFCKMELGQAFDDFKHILSGSWEGIQLCKDLRETLGSDDPAVWIPAFQQAMRDKKSEGKS
jgi:type IV secretion system protein VirB4